MPTGFFTAVVLSAAVATTPRQATVTAFWENDSGYVKPNHAADDHYTAGSMLLVSLPRAQTNQALGVFAGQQIFTPSDTDIAALVPDDRPYAGYLFVGGYWQRVRDRTLDHVQLEIGAVGEWSLGEDAQNWVHELIDDDPANGWDNQVANEITVQLTLRRKWRLPLWTGGQWGADTIPGLGLGVGTVKRQAEAGATFRFGWKLPDDFGPTRIDDLAGGPRKLDAPGFSAYGYARLTGRAVQHNATIDGPDFRSGPGTTVESSPLVGEIETGLALRYQRDAWALDLGYAQVFNTGEYRGQRGGDEWGAVRLSLSCGF